MSDLQELWRAHSKEWASLGPIAIRRIISAKDRRKLELAQVMEDVEVAKEIARSVLDDFLSDHGTLKPAWNELAESDLTGDDVVNAIEAFFLYRLRTIQDSSPGEAMWFFEHNEKDMERKLPGAAMSIIRKTYLEKIRSLSLAAFRGE